MAMLTTPAAGVVAGGKLTPEAIQAKLHLNPQQQAQLQRIVLAGRKVMFSKESHHLMLDQLKGPGTIAQKLGQGIAGLMGLLMQESHQSLPPNLLIPAGMVLLLHAAQFLRQSGQQVSDQDIGAAIEAMTTAMLHAVGINADKVAEIGAQAGKKRSTMPAAKTAAAAGAAGQPGGMR